MIVAGGTYREECQVPAWSRIFGSGARAAAAVSLLSPASRLHAYVCKDWADDARRSMEAFGVEAVFTEIEPDICFGYFHPLSTTQLTPALPPRFDPLIVRGEFVLRFGFVEGEAVVHADRVVYDPQNSKETFRFWDNGSTAGELAIVLNETQLYVSSGSSDWSAVRNLMESNNARIVVVKRGPRGAAVYTSHSRTIVPAFKSDTVFKIGSGDIFSAVFSYLWAECRLQPDEAAEGASKAVSKYVSSRDVQASLNFDGIGPPVPPEGLTGPIYLAGLLIPTKPPVYNGMIAPRDSWMMPPSCNEMIPPGAPRLLALEVLSRYGGSGQAVLDCLPRARRRLSPVNSMR